MPIDVHAHLLPQSAVRAQRTGDEWFGSLVTTDAEGHPVFETDGRSQRMGSPWHYDPPPQRIERMTELGFDRQMVSLLPPLYRYGLPAPTAIDAAQTVNDEIAGMTRDWPDHFSGLATLPLQDMDASLDELSRAVGDLGLVGVSAGTHVEGMHWNDPYLAPILEAIAEIGCLLLIHPIEVRVKSWVPTGAHLANALGNPFESTVAFSSFVFGGVLDRLPGLQLLFVHAGGYIPYGIGRMRHAWEARADARSACVEPPDNYVRRVYFDSLAHDDRALRYLIDVAGSDRVMLGTDYPADMGQLHAVQQINANPYLSAAEKAAILDGNAARAIGLHGAEAP